MEEFDDKESLNLAEALQHKAEEDYINKGLPKKEAQKLGRQKFNEVRRRHAIEFMKKINEKLNSLSNQSIANLLRALIALGLSIEDEEELDYWINLLARESFNRLTLYFENRKTNNKKNPNAPDNDIEGLMSIIATFQEVVQQKSTGSQRAQKRQEFLKKINKILQNDLIAKNKKTKTRDSQFRQQKEQPYENPLDILKNKMISEGVENGSRYWNKVVSDFNNALDQNSFAQTWSTDTAVKKEMDNQKIKELRGIENQQNPSYQKTSDEEKERLAERERQKEKQRQEEKQRQTEKEQQEQKNQKNSENSKQQSQKTQMATQQMNMSGGNGGR